MLNLTRIFLSLVMTFSLAAICAGQSSKRSKRRPTKPQPRSTPKGEEDIQFPVIIAPPGGVVNPDEVREVGQVAVRYYRGRNETTVSAASEVYRKPPLWIGLSYYFTVRGKEVVRPEAVEVTLNTNGMLAFSEGSRLVIEADGRRLDFDPELLGCSKRKCMNIKARVELTTFEQIANSNSVKIRTGPYTFELNESGRDAMRDMLRAIDAPAKSP